MSAILPPRSSPVIVYQVITDEEGDMLMYRLRLNSQLLKNSSMENLTIMAVMFSHRLMRWLFTRHISSPVKYNIFYFC